MSGYGFAQHRAALREGRYLRVVNYHNTPQSTADQLRAELAAYAAAFACVTLEDLDRFYATGEWHLDRPGFIPVFYEGYLNNATVAAPICDELGIVAWFPIITRFVDCPVPDQRAFAEAHHIDLVEEELAAERLAMSWDDVARIAERHVVIPHTGSHEQISKVVTREDVEREIFEPRRAVERVTGREAPGFVWLYGAPYGMNPEQDAAVREAGYRYQISNTMIQRIA
ncbi:polysaccharide deacetylase family protein [Thermoactinospora rubra]|uniref:polysaccharide deacetylase family protein n=1 Tax=Thermoactinospora rubra TaxID=1088767 RepID=UPI000A11A236|nr:polysaccharide deacetylase family protein [Thermoactinospora rubra]